MTVQLRYGVDDIQVVDLYLPATAPRGAVALIHGGNWQSVYGRKGLAPHCRQLAALGYVAGNLGYRRVGDAGGGFPNTCHDVVAALRALADAHGPLRGVVGHSTGGQLALWAARELEPRPNVVVTVCGMNALEVAAASSPTAARSVDNFTGPDRDAADPICRLPLGTRTVVIAPRADPPASRDQSLYYVTAAQRAGDAAELVEVDGDHMSMLDTGSDVWAAVLAAISAA